MSPPCWQALNVFSYYPSVSQWPECREAGSDHLSIQVDTRWWVMLYEKRGSCGEWANRLSENRQTIKQGGGQEGAFEEERESRCFLEHVYKMHVWRRYTTVSFIMMLLCSDHEAMKPRWEDLTPPAICLCPLPLNHTECTVMYRALHH